MSWCQDQDDSKEEEGNNQGKREFNFSEFFDLDADLKEQDQEVRNKEDIEPKTPQNNPAYLPIMALQTHESTIEWSRKGSNRNKCKTLAVEIEHKNSKSLEDVK